MARREYNYQEQVDRFHNNVDWKKDKTLAVAPSSPISLDEMQERWNAYDWLIADDKHFETKCIRHADEERARRRKADAEERRERELVERKFAESTEIKFDFLKKYI